MPPTVPAAVDGPSVTPSYMCSLALSDKLIIALVSSVEYSFKVRS